MNRPVERSDWIGFLAMVVGMFMAILDIQIVSSSLSEIQAGLSAGRDEISWVQTSYLIAEVVMIPLSGWLARVFSTRWLFLGSVLTFTLSSAACALAWDIDSMIVFRALQGFLGGAMIPTVFASAFMIFPKERMPMISVLIGLVATMAPTLGPVVGGWITDALSWHWLFLINLPVGLLVAGSVFLFVRIDKPNLDMLKRIDVAGIVLMALFLGALEYTLEEGPADNWFETDAIVLWTACTATAGILFIWRELVCKNPVVDLFAFRNANFSIGCLFSFVIGSGLYGSVYLLPLFLSRVRGMSSYDIGVTMIVTGAFQFLSAPLAGALSKKMDPRLMLGAGLTLFGVGLWLTTAMTADWGYWELFLPQAVRGVSLMLCFLPINMLALGTLPRDEVQNASGLYNLMRNLGGAIGLAAINTVLISRFDLHRAQLAETLSAGRSQASEMLAALSERLGDLLTTNPELAALKLLGRLLEREAWVMTFSDAFMLLALGFFAALLFMPWIRSVAGNKAPGEAH
ncbi:MAG: DHA2 family efflux MFS transporter permease subunit [Alphaproteobacteria bacterium]|nr:DHA2 family efflux MFS transporter permease subunit [Alphaproteobacteria bacterium]